MPRNVINQLIITEIIQNRSIGRPLHIVDWINSTFRSWVLDNVTASPVMDERELNSPTAIMLEIANPGFVSKLRSTVFLINIAHYPEWVAKALANKDHLVFIHENALGWDTYNHWFDYLETQPVKQLRYTVEHLKEAVAKWDKQLAKQKLVSSLDKGVELIEHEIFSNYETPVCLVKLLTEEAYTNEGAAMSHCVGRGAYWNKSSTEIWSLRTVGSKPLATIEIRITELGKSWVQRKAYRNAAPEAWVLTLLDAYFATQNIVEYSTYDRCYSEAIDEPVEEIQTRPRPDDEDLDRAISRVRRAKSKLASRDIDEEEVKADVNNLMNDFDGRVLPPKRARKKSKPDNSDEEVK